MKNKDIENKVAYFNKVVKNMDNKQYEKDDKISTHENSSAEIEEICPSIDEYFCSNLLDWIELVENSDLHKALKSLSLEEQTLLSYLYYKDKTQTEVARIYGIAQQNISKKITSILNKIKIILFKK